MANPFDQFDTPEASANPFDQFDDAATFTRTAVPEGGIRPGDVEARRKQGAANTANEGPNVVRERQTVAGEIGGGLGQFVGDIGTMLNPAEKDMGFVERALYGLRAPLGLLRAAAPIATLGTSPYLTNKASEAGEAVSDSLAKKGYTTLADVLGSLASASIDVGSQTALTKAVAPVRASLAQRFPNRAESTAKLAGETDAQVAAVNAEAAAQRSAAERAAAQSRGYAEAGQQSVDIMSEIKRQEAIKAAARAKAGVTTRSKLDELAPTQSSAQDVGAEFQKVYKSKLGESKDRFSSEYDAVLEKADKLQTNADNYRAAIRSIHGEKGVSQPNVTRAESAAAKAQKKFNAIDAENEAEDTADALLEQMKTGTPEQQRMAQMSLDEMGKSQLPENPTFADLIKERQRLKGAQRAAEQAGNDNLARQYKTLQQSLADDISGNSSVSRALGEVDDAYRTEHVPYFGNKSEIRLAGDNTKTGAEAVVDRLVPKNTDKLRADKIDRLVQFTSDNPELQRGIGDSFIKNLTADASNASGELSLSRISSKWRQYADSRTDDKALKAVLGDRYEGMRRLVQNAEQAKPLSIDKLLKEQLKHIDVEASARSTVYGQQLKELDTLDKVLGSGEKTVAGIKIPGSAGSIETERLKKVAALKKEFEEKAAKLGVKPYPEHAGQLVGSAMILHGLVGSAMGSPVAVAQMLSGVGVMIAAPVFFKMLGKARGMELLNRAMRATPGSSNAFAAGRLIQKYVNTELEKE